MLNYQKIAVEILDIVEATDQKICDVIEQKYPKLTDSEHRLILYGVAVIMAGMSTAARGYQ